MSDSIHNSPKVVLTKQYVEEASSTNPVSFARARRLIFLLVSLWFVAFMIENFVLILFGTFTFKIGFGMVFYMFLIFAISLSVYDMGFRIGGVIPVLNAFVTFYKFNQVVTAVGIGQAFNAITIPLVISALLQFLIGMTLLAHPGVKSYCQVMRAANCGVKQELRRQKEENSDS